ncbi:hypothetical protein [Arundinibacter roseus]|uniref:Uncharacterized protein n=1 Tax=Arundinibacter roseus TaxID=2070510 RepID=A0A4V2X9M9_9BACT|nr:hypothetical protein [Arundinibacter roseus]TDB64415.1 hypothetical protein EZE20_12080 [Arundinibacter roseus]
MPNLPAPLHITDLLTLNDFYDAVATKVVFSSYHLVSSGEEGVQEVQHIFEKSVLPGDMIMTAQIAETPLTDNDTGLTRATFACTLMVLEKMGGGARTAAVKLAVRNRTWLKMLAVIGFIRSCAEYAAANSTASDELEISLHQDRLLPIGSIANATVQGWLIDIDVTIPINHYLFLE